MINALKAGTLKTVCIMLSLTLSLITIAGAAYGSEVEGVDLTNLQRVAPKAEIIIKKQTFEKQVNQIDPQEILCVGSATILLPSIGECPDEPGYVEIGFPECTQYFEVPRHFTMKEIAPGLVRLVCELDYANSVPIGVPECDYSRCMYVEEPEWPYSGTLGQ